MRVSHAEFRRHFHQWSNRLLNFQAGTYAVRSKVACPVLAVNGGVLAIGRHDHVIEGRGTINDVSLRIENGYHLAGVVLESVNIQRHAIVKDSCAATDGCPPGWQWRRPGKSNTRRHSAGSGDALLLDSQPAIEGKTMV